MFSGAFFGGGFIHKGANRFGGVLECGVIFIDDGLGDDRNSFFINATATEFVMQSLGEHIADGSLGISTTVVKGYFKDFWCGEFGTAQVETNLGAISVGDDHVPTG